MSDPNELKQFCMDILELQERAKKITFPGLTAHMNTIILAEMLRDEIVKRPREEGI